jgi:cystathionine beta-lyase/cystathionine gamma-synthase
MVLHPATMSHLKVNPSLRQHYGITDSLVRMSVGLEHPDDILADIEQALAV